MYTYYRRCLSLSASWVANCLFKKKKYHSFLFTTFGEVSKMKEDISIEKCCFVLSCRVMFYFFVDKQMSIELKVLVQYGFE